MTKQVQRRRGTAAQHTSFTGADGEITVNTTNKSAHVHDGATAGGVELARVDMDNVTSADILSAVGITSTVTELNYTDGVTSSIQSQLNTKAPLNAPSFTGNISVTGTVDGRDIDADGTKLDTIETGATADQTGAQIKALYEAESNTNAFTDAEQSKLTGIETGADVTDTANVTSAGALMDSELADIAAVKAIDQGLATTDDVEFNSVEVSSLNGGQLAGHRNKIINGNFGVNQRSVTGTVTLSAGEYGHDRWKAGSSGCTYTFATSENVTTITISAGSLVQVIEGVNIQSGTHILSWSGTVQMAIDGGTAAGSGVTATLTGGTNAEVETSGIGTLSLVQLEPGTQATPFEHRHYSVELAMCQRYHRKFAASNLGALFPFGFGFNATKARFHMNLGTEMRAGPSVSISNVLLSTTGGTTYNVTSASLNSSTPSHVDFDLNVASSLFVEKPYFVKAASGLDGYIELDSEL